MGLLPRLVRRARRFWGHLAEGVKVVWMGRPAAPTSTPAAPAPTSTPVLSTPPKGRRTRGAGRRTTMAGIVERLIEKVGDIDRRVKDLESDRAVNKVTDVAVPVILCSGAGDKLKEKMLEVKTCVKNLKTDDEDLECVLAVLEPW